MWRSREGSRLGQREQSSAFGGADARIVFAELQGLLPRTGRRHLPHGDDALALAYQAEIHLAIRQHRYDASPDRHQHAAVVLEPLLRPELDARIDRKSTR